MNAEALLIGDPAALDPAVAGGKAAGLARAKAAGLPVLPGWIVPADVFAPAIAMGSAALMERNAAAANLAIARTPMDPSLVWSIRAASTGFRSGAVVRSSSPSEDDPRWSGAFATYHRVIPEDLENAMKGCVASLFSHDALGRAAALGLDPMAVGMAVLVQPWRPFDAGGTAVLARDGSVTVNGVRSDPGGVVGGRSPGTRAVVGPDGSILGDPTFGGSVGSDLAMSVASLSRRVGDALDLDSIEWGVHEGRVELLQVRRGTAVPMAPAGSGGLLDGRVHSRRATEAELHLARVAMRFPGPTGDRYVLPWAAVLETLPAEVPAPGMPPVDALVEIGELADTLMESAWGNPSSSPSGPGDAWLAQGRRILADPLGTEAFVGRKPTTPMDVDLVARVLGLLAGLADTLVARGSLTHPELLWRLSSHELERAVAVPGYRPTVPLGPDRWEAFVSAVVAAEGDRFAACPVASGSGCGPAHVLVAGAGRPGPRAVLVAKDPVPQIAPLLWGSAGLVTTSGSEAAHLFEVARSLGVPAVTTSELSVDDLAGPDTFLSVDGDRGEISVMSHAGRVPRLAGVGA